MLSGAAVAPSWIVWMEAAKEWSTPPWKLIGGTKTLWYARFKALREARQKVIEATHA